MFQVKTKRSAGMRVTAAVHGLIRQGNAARTMRDWATAARSYRAALDADPALHPIWVQLGHMLAEAGDWAAAGSAYDMAAARGAGIIETQLHLGHMYKRAGNPSASAHAYMEAARAGSEEALDELHIRVARLMPIDRAVILRAIRSGSTPDAGAARPSAIAAAEATRAIDRAIATVGSEDLSTALLSIRRTLPTAPAAAQPGDAAPTPILYDISDLIAHFRHHRLPTGIQRVQIEVITRALTDPSCANRICCFVDGNESLTEIPLAMFAELAALASAGADGDEPVWVDAIARLFLHLATCGPLRFRDGECLINLGTSWWIYNYFLIIRNAKRAHGISFVAFVHDLIPLFAAEHCVRGVQEDYVGWLIGAFRHTDHFIANSHSTARDLVRAGQQLGHAITEADVTVATLDADFRRPTSDWTDRSLLTKWDLAETPYVLLVSTIESRKNHVLALQAWSEMLRETQAAGDDRIPQLVFVGRSGWLNDHVFGRLAADPWLNRRVTIIERVSDDDLALLYRESLFTLYPSHYEGWGLPITESLSYGKVPVVANNSSLPEAGEGYAVLFESNSVRDLVRAVRRIMDDAPWREAEEQRIRRDFRPRPWAAIADQIIGTARAIAEQNAGGWSVPHVDDALYYAVSHYKGVRIWTGLDGGEVFRIGEGWHWPEAVASRTKPGGGILQFVLPDGDGPWRMYIRLQGLEEQDCPYEIRIDDRIVTEGTMEPRTIRWTGGFVIPAAERLTLDIRVIGSVNESIAIFQGGHHRPQPASIGVAGFFLCRDGDTAARTVLTGATVLGSLSEIAAYRER